MRKTLSILTAALLCLASGSARAETCTTVTQFSSWPGTTAPTDVSLAGKVVARTGLHADIGIKAAANETWALLGYELGRWYPIGEVVLVAADYDGSAHGRFTPGSGFSYYGVWAKDGSATDPTSIRVCTDLKR